MSVETIEIDPVTTSTTAEGKEDAGLPRACSICKNGFDKVVPKLLPCLHSFCQTCLEGRLTDQQPSSTPATLSGPRATALRLKCPKCGQEFLVPSRGISSLIDNQFILEIVTKPSGESESEVHVCTSCEDDSASSSYCLNCSEWLCDACVQAHQRVRVTKDHEIKTGEELRDTMKHHGRNERSLFCHKHPSEKLKLFCVKCERLTCRDCQLLEHKDHQYQFVNEAASRYRECFKKRLKNLEEKLGPLAESIEAVQNCSTHLDHKSEVVASEIKKSSNDIIKAVKQRENVLLNELQALVYFKRKMLTKQSKDLNLMQDILKHNYEFTKHAVYHGSDVSLLSSQRQLISRIQNLLSLKYKVTPVAHSDLKFVTEAVKLGNAILKAGSVMTPSNRGMTVPPTNSRSPNHPLQHVGNHATMKVNPLHSLNAFHNRHLHSNPSASSVNPKPSSKVYPNVVASQIATGLPVVRNGVRSSTMAFPSSTHHSQISGVARLLRPSSTPRASIPVHPSSYCPSSSHVPRMTTRLSSSSEGSGVILHHIESNNQELARLLAHRHENATENGRKISSFADALSSVTSQPSQVFSSSSRELRRESTVSSCCSTEHGLYVPSSSPLSNHTSPSPLSPSFPKISPNTAPSSRSPSISSPPPQTSPRFSQVQPSPVPSPLPTFLDSEFRAKIKMEKDLSPGVPCSRVKSESGRNTSCSLSSESNISYSAACACGPPSNDSGNEDWCAVCHNGGELLCCDTCPKVFHLNCHVPSLISTPRDAWSCGLCEPLDSPRNPTDVPSVPSKRRAPVGEMSEKDAKRCEKMLLALFCHPDSTPFHDKVSKAVPNYYKIIQKPMDLTSIKTKLQPMHFEHYNSINEFIADCRLIFSNCARFNGADSEVGKMGKRLEEEFNNIAIQYCSERLDDEDEPRAKRKREEA